MTYIYIDPCSFSFLIRIFECLKTGLQGRVFVFENLLLFYRNKIYFIIPNFRLIALTCLISSERNQIRLCNSRISYWCLIVGQRRQFPSSDQGGFSKLSYHSYLYFYYNINFYQIQSCLRWCCAIRTLSDLRKKICIILSWLNEKKKQLRLVVPDEERKHF